MRNVGAVEALTLLDERLGPQHLFSWTQPHRHVENSVARGVGEPFVVDSRHAVARCEDHVDEVVAAVRLAEPMRERHVDLVGGALERSRRVRKIGRPDKNIEIFRVPFDPGVASKGERAADEYLDVFAFERCQGAAVELPLLGR